MINIREDDEEEDWPEMGPVNVSEAKHYVDKITDIFDNLSDLLHEDCKDALPNMIRSFHKLVVKHLKSMSDDDPEVVIHLITDLECIYLRQHILKGGVDIVIPDKEPPSRHDFIWKLPEKH